VRFTVDPYPLLMDDALLLADAAGDAGWAWVDSLWDHKNITMMDQNMRSYGTMVANLRIKNQDNTS
jgi:hypothetical protein